VPRTPFNSLCFSQLRPRLFFIALCRLGAFRAYVVDGMVWTLFNSHKRASLLCRTTFGACLAALALAACSLAPAAPAQEAQPDWQEQARKAADAHDWGTALKIVNAQLDIYPGDMDIRAWHARILLWSGHLPEAEKEFDQIVKAVPDDPDNWESLGSLYIQEGRSDEALRAVSRAVELDPQRADLRDAKAQILAAIGEMQEALSQAQRAQQLDPTSTAAQTEASTLGVFAKHELRLGFDNDAFNFTVGNHGQWVSLVSRWDSRWTTSAAVDTYQVAGTPAEKVAGSVTATSRHWGALTVGATVGHDNTVIPRTEAFFEGDHGWRISETNPIRGVEVTYGQHWYWYSSARVLTVNENTLVYLPRDWTWSLAMTGARAQFTGTASDWKPSGLSRLGFPMKTWGVRRLTGNVFFAVGTEDFAQVTQIGSFSSQTYGGGLKFQITTQQDITAYGAFQQRTQDHTDTSFGWSYGIRF
jgi:tetratricopeptide (TPR) repeat protein